MPLHQPQESDISRRKLLRMVPAGLLTSLLAGCGDDAPLSTPQKREFRPLDIADPVATIKPEASKPEIPYIPNNRFDSLPPASLSGDGAFLKEVTKISMEDRKGYMIAVQGGGRVSDEVRNLQNAGLRPFETLSEIKTAYKSGKLISLPTIDEGRYFAVGMIGTEDPDNKEWYHLIHPDAYNRFNEHVARVFYYKTGKMLKVGGLVRSTAYQASLRKNNSNATKNRSSHEFGRTIDFSIPQVFNPRTGMAEAMSPEEREFISKLLTYYEKKFPNRTSWLVENGNCYHGTHYPLEQH